jgi:two-component system sensor histidine kinase BaeS
MSEWSLLSRLSLRMKLVLSYLVVSLGAILILAIAISLAVQNYFDNTQLEALHNQASYRAQYLAYVYQRQGGTWGNDTLVRLLPNDPVLVVIVDERGGLVGCSQPAFLVKGNCNDPTLKQALVLALNGQENNGRLQVSTANGSFSSLYVCIPLRVGERIIGAMFLSSPQIYPNAFPKQVNTSIIITGVIISLIVLLFSLMLAGRLTQPLKLLTQAAEQMKHGKYAQRVTTPRSQDELGRLAQTFNEMADTIEADVTELRRQEQARRDLLANIAHDLATPLTAIQGFSEALADDIISDPAARQETAQHIRREVLRLRRLVADLREMSSLESNHARLDLAPLNMHALVEETLAVIAPECQQKGITLHNDIAETIPPVLADSDRITRVLLNLLDNARRYTPEGGEIRVGAMIKAHDLCIQVSDTGTGIDPEDLPHIFERFYRADRARSEATGGSGLGLAIVRAIITAHGGHIQAESTLNQGTCITFTLPLAREATSVS